MSPHRESPPDAQQRLEQRLAALSPAKRAFVERQLARAKAESKPAAIPRRDVAAPAPLSFSQELLWQLEQAEPGRATYNVSRAVRIAGPLDVERLRIALDRLVTRHPTLRTTFAVQAGGVVAQTIGPPRPVALQVTDLREIAPPLREAEIVRRLREAASVPFDLAQDVLLRATLLHCAEDDWALLLVWHHIVSDEASAKILFDDLARDDAAVPAAALTEPALEYADFAAWQRATWSGPALEGLVDHWAERLRDAPPALALPFDRPRPALPTFDGARISVVFPERLAGALTQLGRAHGTTPFVTLFAAFAALLHRYSRQDDLLVGSVFSGRGRAEFDGILGYFSTVLPLRSQLAGDPTFTQMLAAARETYLDAADHADVPFDRLVLERSARAPAERAPAFNVLFTLLADAPAVPRLGAGLRLEPIAIDRGSAKFDLSVAASFEPAGLRVAAEFRTQLFDPATVERMLQSFGVLLEGVIADADQPLSRLPVLTVEQRRALTPAPDAAAAAYPRNATVDELVGAQARRTPAAIALACEDATGAPVTLTYAELDRRAETLATVLVAHGVGPGVGVGVCADRSHEAVTALLAVLKAGGYYVPLDPDYPAERLAYMVRDAAVPVLLTLDRLGTLVDELASASGATIVRLDTEWEELAARAHAPVTAATRRTASAGDPAYVIYTSGSTGRPKGVMIRHRSLVNLITAMTRMHALTAADTLVAVASFSFDIAGFDLWVPLTAGARIVLAPRDTVVDGRRLAALLTSSGATLLQATPATWRMLLAAGWAGKPDLTMITGGEALTPDLAAALLARGRVLWNQYGPTETTIYSAYWQVRAGEPIALGEPVANTQLYVLEPSGEPAPLGVPGELWIGGDGVAAGYLNRPELTAERFVPDPFHGDPQARMYRTGDLVRRHPGGRLEYLGRLDGQVKLRGYRIELGEIDAALVAQPGVAQAVTLVRDDDADPRLVAYLTGTALPDDDALRAALRTTLPAFMLPAAFVRLERLPLTGSGKVDRNALPAPQAERHTGLLLAPRTPVEAALLPLFVDVLRCERAGVDDDFFALGGHSLLAMRLLDRIAVSFGTRIPLRAFFDAPTVAELAAAIEPARVAAAPAAGGIPRRAEGEPAPLSAAQETLWLLQRGASEGGAYNLRSARRLEGALDVAALQTSLNLLVARHGALRTTFATHDGTVRQTIGPARTVALESVDLSDRPAAERNTALDERLREFGRRPFDLARDLLLRALLVKTGAAEHVLLLVVHHIVADGSSLEVAWRDVAAFYAAADGAMHDHAPPAVAFADYVRWQRERLHGERLDALAGYWHDELAGVTRGLALPTDRPRAAVPSFEGAHEVALFPAALLAAVQRFALAERTTAFTVLLAAYAAVLHRSTAQDDVVVGSPVEGRDQAELDGAVGYFVNTLPLRARFADDPTFEQLVRALRETCLSAYEHQAMPVDLLQTALQDGTGGALFGTLFTYAGAVAGSSFGSLAATPIAFETGAAKFDLAVAMSERDDGLRVSLEYRPGVFDAATIRRFSAHLRCLLEAAVADPSRRISALPLIGADEQRALEAAWNTPAPRLRPDVAIHTLFERHAAARPDAPALSLGDEQLSYGELDRRANRLAHRLRGLGVRADVLVGLCLERSLELVVAILAVLKAGGAYVPFDPASPAERLQFMLEDAQPLVLLTTGDLAPLLPPTSAQIVQLDAPSPDAAASTPPAVDVSPDDLAYVIYTSGSTGRPKGVMVTHRNVARLLSATEPDFGFDQHDVWTLFHSYAFDFSVWELWGALAYGGRLVVVPYLVSRSPDAFWSLLRREGVTVLNQTPSAFRELMWVDAAQAERLAALRVVIFGGEMLEPSRLAPWFARYGDARPQLVNMYGITETTVHVTYRPLRAADVDAEVRSPIGRAIPDLQLFVFDAAQQPVPAGIPGELYVGGAGVARGYLHRPELTAQRFVADPHDPGGVRRRYRTGDRVRMLPGGELEYLERADLQVKLRGFRIELGEIEVALRRLPGVRDAVAVVREDATGEPSLVAYYVTTPGARDAAGEAQLRAALTPSLPDYMIPARLVALAALPLNHNGKIDRKALPAPEQIAREARTIVPPRTPIETEVAALFGQILQLDAVGVDEDFFALGGHSLLAIRLLAAIDERFAIALSLATIFGGPSVAAIADAVEQRLAAATSDVPAELLAEFDALSDDDALRLLHADLEGSGT